MGKAALVAIVGFVVMGAVYSLGANRSALGTDDRVADYQYETLAKNAAQVGHERAEQVLTENFASTSFSGEYDGIPYGVIVSVSGSDATVESEAVATDGQGNDIPFRIRSKYKLEMVEPDWIPEEVPQWFKPAFISEGNMDLGGNSDADIYADGDNPDELNANMHTNSNFAIGGNSEVRGFVTSVGSATIGGNASVDPNYNPSDVDPVQEGVDPIDIPAFDADAYLAETLDKTGKDAPDQTSSSLHLSSSQHYDLGGTRESPYIWHVEDELQISGDVTFDGYVMFIVGNDMKISGNVNMGTVDYDGGDESNIALYAGGNADIDVTGNTDLYGQMFAGGDVFLAGDADIYGNIATLGSLDVTGNANIYYRKPSPALTRAWAEPEPQIRLVSHNEW